MIIKTRVESERWFALKYPASRSSPPTTLLPARRTHVFGTTAPRISAGVPRAPLQQAGSQKAVPLTSC